jgi:hypothetical protein
MIIVVTALIVAVVVVLWLAGRSKGVGKGTGTSIRRGAATHYNIDGSPKRVYDTLDDARLAAARQGSREGSSMSAYRCRGCGKYHVGHAR